MYTHLASRLNLRYTLADSVSRLKTQQRRHRRLPGQLPAKLPQSERLWFRVPHKLPFKDHQGETRFWPKMVMFEATKRVVGFPFANQTRSSYLIFFTC